MLYALFVLHDVKAFDPAAKTRTGDGLQPRSLHLELTIALGSQISLQEQVHAKLEESEAQGPYSCISFCGRRGWCRIAAAADRRRRMSSSYE